MRSWASWYNLNLRGQDRFPVGEMVTFLPIQNDYQSQLRTLASGPVTTGNPKPPKPKGLPPGQSSTGLPPAGADIGWRS